MSPSPGGGAQGDPNGSNAPQGNGAKAIDESRTNSMGQFFNGVGSLVGKAIPQNDFQAQLAPQDITSYSPYIDPAAKIRQTERARIRLRPRSINRPGKTSRIKRRSWRDSAEQAQTPV